MIVALIVGYFVLGFAIAIWVIISEWKENNYMYDYDITRYLHGGWNQAQTLAIVFLWLPIVAIYICFEIILGICEFSVLLYTNIKEGNKKR